LVGVLEIVEKGRARDVAYDTRQRSSNIPVAILQRNGGWSRHDRERLDGGETKSYKNIVLATNLLLDLGQDIVIPEEGVLLLADLDGVTAELRNEDLVTGVDTHGDTLAVAVKETGANGEDLGLVLLLDGSLGEEDTGGSLGLGLDALNQDAVQEGGEGLDVAEDRLEMELS
jgi:hypothetical protein